MSSVAYPNLGLLATRTKELLAELQQFCGGHREAIEADITLELRIQRFRDGLSFIGKLPPALLALLTVEPIETSVPLSNGAGDIHHKLDQILKLLSEEDPSTPQALELLTVIRDGVLSLGDPSSMGELIKLVQGQQQQLSDLRGILLDNKQRDVDLDLFTDEMVERLHRGFTGVLAPLRNNQKEGKTNPPWLVDNARFFLVLFERFKHTFPENGLVHLGSKAQSVRDLLRPVRVADEPQQGTVGADDEQPSAPAPNPAGVLQEIRAEEQDPDGLVSTLVTREVRRHLERGSARSVDEEPDDERPVRNGQRRHQEQPSVDDDLDGEGFQEEPGSAIPERSEPPLLVKDGIPDPTLADSPKNGAALKSLLAQEGD